MVRMIRKSKQSLFVTEERMGQSKSVFEFQYYDDQEISHTWNPNMDIFETEEDLVILVEAAGLDEESVQLHAVDRRLILSGERKLQTDESIIQYHQLEIQFMPFQKTIILPNAIDVSKIQAEYHNGMLKICVRKHDLKGRE